MFHFHHLFACISAFYEILNGLAIRDTAVEGSTFNRVIDGDFALALHGIEASKKPPVLDIIIYEPTKSQLDYLCMDITDILDGITGQADIPILKLRELDIFKIIRRDLTLRITLERNKKVPEHTLTHRYGSTVYRVQPVNNISRTITGVSAIIEKPGEEFMDDWKEESEIICNSIGETIETAHKGIDFAKKLKEQKETKNALADIRKSVPEMQSLKLLADAFIIFRKIFPENKLPEDVDQDVCQVFQNREIELKNEINPED